MGLHEYKKKRDFKKTSEPAGAGKTKGRELIFVVQKHDATNLHYDFRLELEGVLKSWAVPKGPTLNPQEKRLAMMVEDHPFDYKDFEGVIPEGQYGAGKVIVWDNGTYHAKNILDRRENEKVLKQGLEKGDLKFILNGKKLKGEFALVKMKTAQKNSWLLIKKKDEFSTAEDILEDSASVLTGNTLEEVDGGGEKKKSPL
ncbi:MAG: DNA polymerase ligase N-terminal domain-containing protein [Ignavibacteria bacterium]